MAGTIPWWPDLSLRAHALELMDQPDSNREQLDRTLRQLPLINLLVSRSRYLLKRYLVEDALRKGLEQVRVLDAGAGGGDLGRYIVQLMRGMQRQAGRKMELQIDCCELDPRVAAFAREACAAYPELRVVESSVFDLQAERYDYVINNHFLHHLSDTQLGEFLELSHTVCRGVLICNDLERTMLSYLPFRALAPLVLRRSFAAFDGCLSIRRGFTTQELLHALHSSPWAPQAWAGEAWVNRLVPGRVCIIARA